MALHLNLGFRFSHTHFQLGQTRVFVCLSAATPVSAACVPATGAPIACVRTSSSRSCCAVLRPNSAGSFSTGSYVERSLVL